MLPASQRRQISRLQKTGAYYMVFYDCQIYRLLGILRSFDSEGRPYRIRDDDLEEVLSKSDYHKGRGDRHV